MTEAKWLARPRHHWPRLCAMIRYLEEQVVSHRRLHLFGCACCRRVWELLPLEGARAAVEVAEAYVDGAASEADLVAAHHHPDFARLEAALTGEGFAGVGLSYCVVAAIRAARELASPLPDVSYIARATSRDRGGDFPVDADWSRSGEWRAVRPDEAELGGSLQALRDVFGNPFRPVAFAPRWRTATAVSLARGMYEARDFSGMPMLANALRDAGCDDGGVLAHCHGTAPHVRGCWVVDLVLGKR